MQEAVDSTVIKYPFFRIVLAFLICLWPGVAVEFTMSLATGTVAARQLGLVLDEVIVTIAAFHPARNRGSQQAFGQRVIARPPAAV